MKQNQKNYNTNNFKNIKRGVYHKKYDDASSHRLNRTVFEMCQQMKNYQNKCAECQEEYFENVHTLFISVLVNSVSVSMCFLKHLDSRAVSNVNKKLC